VSEASVDAPPRPAFRVAFRVEFVDTDAMAVVHHASYFRWLERARVEWLRAIGMSYAEMDKTGWALPLASAEIRYLRPLVFDDEGFVELRMGELGQSEVTMHYRVIKVAGGKETVVTEASTHHVTCRRKETEKGSRWVPARTPEEWRKQWLPLSAPKSSKSR